MDAAGDHGDGGAVRGGPEHLGLALGQRRVADGEAVHRQRRVDDPQALVHPAYGVGQLGGRGVLDDEPVGARLHRAAQEAGAAERGHDQDPRLRRDPAYLGRGADAVEARHLDVEQGDVGAVLEHGRYDGVPGRHLGDHLEVGLQAQQRRQRAPDQGLVVGEQQPDRRGASPTTTLSEKPRAGGRGDRRVPPSGGGTLAQPGQPVARAGRARRRPVVADLDLVLAEHDRAPASRRCAGSRW